LTIGEHVLKISGKPCPHTALFRGCIDTDEDKFSLLHGFVDVSREEEVASASLADNSFKAWFVDRQLEIWAVPCIDTGLVKVDDGHSNVGTF
jgi:hypothetical protein